MQHTINMILPPGLSECIQEVASSSARRHRSLNSQQEADQVAQAKARSLDDDRRTLRACARRGGKRCASCPPRPRTGGSSSSGIRRCRTSQWESFSASNFLCQSVEGLAELAGKSEG